MIESKNRVGLAVDIFKARDMPMRFDRREDVIRARWYRSAKGKGRGCDQWRAPRLTRCANTVE